MKESMVSAGLSMEAIALIAARFRIFSEPMRLKLLLLLSEGELCVGELVERSGGHQANVSKHLGILLDAGIVKRRKDGLSAYYRIVDPTVLDLCGTVCGSLRQKLTADVEAVREFRRQA